MNRLLLPLLALAVACVDKTDTDIDPGTDSDAGSDTDAGTDSDVGTDSDSDTAAVTAIVTVYVSDTASQPVAAARITLSDGSTGTTDDTGFAVIEAGVSDTVDVEVLVDGFTRHYETATVTDGRAAVFAIVSPVEVVTISSAANDTIVTVDDGLVFRLNGGFAGDRRGNEVLTDVEISVLDTPERLRALPTVPPGYTVVTAADILFTREGVEQEFVGNAQITFPPPVGLHPSRYSELEAFYYDGDGFARANGSGANDCADDYRDDRGSGTLTVHVCHLTVWALMLPIRDEVCIDVDATSDGETPEHPVRMSAVSECGEGVAVDRSDSGSGQVCLPHCGGGEQTVRVDSVDTRGDAPLVTGGTAAVVLPFADDVDGPVSATIAVHTTSQDTDEFTAAQGDCDDSRSDVYPGAEDPIDADGLDSNCDGVDGVDADRDGYNDLVDCDDSDRSVRPGRMDNGLIGLSDAGNDNDCDGVVDEDGDYDQDGFIHIDFGGTDCNDRLPNVFPGAVDEPGDGMDNNCDGLDGDEPITDIDGDGASDAIDCNDRYVDAFPGAVERCDGVDTDCDGRPNISAFDRDSCLDDAEYDDTYSGTFTIDVSRDGQLVDGCSSDIGLTLEDGRTPSELMLSAGETGTCDLASVLGGQTVQFLTTDASVAPWGLATGTLVLGIGTVTHEAALNGFARGGRLTASASFDTEDEALGPVTVHVAMRTSRASVPTDALADDADFDGVVSGEDCDDNNPNVRPGATEACNGVDDNCNGDIDENACPDTGPAAGEYGLQFSMKYHTGFNNTKDAPPPPAIAMLVDEEMSSASFDNPVFEGQSDASLNVINSMTVNPPGEGGAISGTLTLASDSLFPSGTMTWTGTANSEGFSGIAVRHHRALNLWTHVAFTAAPIRNPTETDADFDGTPTDLDCDDNDPNRRFGAHEVCNGIDDDCDGGEDNPFDDVCPIMEWTGGSFPMVFSVVSDDGLRRWSREVEVDVNIATDGAFAMENPVFSAPSGAQVNVISMSMSPPDGDGSVSGVVVLESTVQDIEGGSFEWTGNIDIFGISGFALVSSGPRRWTHIAIAHREN